MNKCPYCGHEVPDGDFAAEIEHMTEKHPEIIRERLIAAGLSPELAEHQLRSPAVNLIAQRLDEILGTTGGGYLRDEQVSVINDAVMELIRLQRVVDSVKSKTALDVVAEKMAAEDEAAKLRVALLTGHKAEEAWIKKADAAERKAHPANWAKLLLERDDVQGRKVLERMLAYYEEHDGKSDDFGRLFIVIDAAAALGQED
jgi:DNA helicase IV